MRTGTARVAARGSRLCVATSAINSRTWSELSWGGKQAYFERVCFCTRKRQQASEALDSARAKAGTVLNFLPAFSYFSTEAITCIVISRRHRYALSMWYICGNILLRIFRHISVYITYTVAYFDILFEFRMFSEYHFSDMEIYHMTNFTRITRILLSILLILLISSFRGKSSTRLGGNRSVIPAPTPSLTLTRRLLGAEVRDQVRDEAGEREQGLRQDDGGVSSVRWFVRRWGNY